MTRPTLHDLRLKFHIPPLHYRDGVVETLLMNPPRYRGVIKRDGNTWMTDTYTERENAERALKLLRRHIKNPV